MIFDTTKKGLETVFKDWQVTAIQYVLNAKSPVNSRQTYHAVLLKHQISRASIINFLNDMVTEEIFGYDTRTGKGGHQGLYFSNSTANLEALSRVLHARFAKALNRELWEPVTST